MSACLTIVTAISRIIANIFLRLVNKLKNNSTLVLVVAVALLDHDDHVLMQRRQIGGAHGGLWEFPGGKVKAGETAELALIREIREELGIELAPEDITPLSFASDPAQPPAAREPYVILLYICRRWEGQTSCLAGDEIAWFAPDEIMALAMPPLDVPLAHMLLRSI